VHIDADDMPLMALLQPRMHDQSGGPGQVCPGKAAKHGVRGCLGHQAGKAGQIEDRLLLVRTAEGFGC